MKPANANAPRPSVVVASRQDRGLLDACLGSLLPQCGGADLIVARARPVEELARAYPAATFVEAPEGATMPALRALGLSAARGDVVLLTEDHCVPAADWVASLVGASRAGADIVGGVMENGRRERAIDWAVLFAEYGTYLDGARTEQPQVTAANVAYSRAVLADVIAAAREGQWEKVAHDRLAASGRSVTILRTATVYQNRSWRFAAFCRDRFEHGNDYARTRLVEEGATFRWIFLLGTPALPVVLAGRIARAAGRRRLGAFARALPWTLVFLGAWSLGEAAGYLQGPRQGAGSGTSHG